MSANQELKGARRELEDARTQLANSEHARKQAHELLNNLVDTGGLRVRPSDREHVIKELTAVNTLLLS